MADAGTTATVKSALRTLDILEFVVAQNRPLAAHEIATALAIPVSSLSYLLSTLADRGYLERAARRYVAGAGLARLRAPGPAHGLVEQVAPIVRGMRMQLNETASFFVPRGYEVETLVSEVGIHALRYTLEPGQRAPLHAFAAGKAILATFGPDELDDYFAGADRPAFTPATIVAEAALRDQIAEIRRTGIARTREEHTSGICGLARIVTIDGLVAGAISTAIPIARFTPEMEAKAIDLLTRAADLLAYRPSPPADGPPPPA